MKNQSGSEHEAILDGLALRFLRQGFQIKLESAKRLLVTNPPKSGHVMVMVFDGCARLVWPSYTEPSKFTIVSLPLADPEMFEKLDKVVACHFCLKEPPCAGWK